MRRRMLTIDTADHCRVREMLEILDTTVADALLQAQDCQRHLCVRLRSLLNFFVGLWTCVLPDVEGVDCWSYS